MTRVKFELETTTKESDLCPGCGATQDVYSGYVHQVGGGTYAAYEVIRAVSHHSGIDVYLLFGPWGVEDASEDLFYFVRLRFDAIEPLGEPAFDDPTLSGFHGRPLAPRDAKRHSDRDLFRAVARFVAQQDRRIPRTSS